MASPQLEHGHTRIANELLEAIARAPLSARELRVLLVVARETYGWSRKTAPLTTYRLAKMIGLDPAQRTKAARTLASLKARGILTNGAAGLGIQKNYETWQTALPVLARALSPDVPPATTPASESDTGPKRIRSKSEARTGSEPDADPVSESDPLQSNTPKTRKKGARTAEPPAPHHQQVMDEWARLFKERTGSHPHITARYGACLHRLLKNHLAEEVLDVVRLGLRRGTLYMQNKKWFDLLAIEHEYNQLLALRADLEGGLS